MNSAVLARLQQSDEPSVRFKILTQVQGRSRDSDEARSLQEQIRTSPRVCRLLSERRAGGEIPFSPYAKWYGPHWVLVALADLDYLPGDGSLVPLREQVYAWLFSDAHLSDIPTIAGRVRAHASQEGNALYALLALGQFDERAEELARRLVEWQWPDGGWNCAKNPVAENSSFMESLIPLRALALHARLTGNEQSRQTAERAAEVFLKRRLFRRQHTGNLMRPDFTRLHYPCYWHYDILFGLKVMAEAGWIADERCREALDLLEAKRLPDGGFPAEEKYYRYASGSRSGCSLVDWGGVDRSQLNEFVTVDALFALKAAGRLETD